MAVADPTAPSRPGVRRDTTRGGALDVAPGETRGRRGDRVDVPRPVPRGPRVRLGRGRTGPGDPRRVRAPAGPGASGRRRGGRPRRRLRVPGPVLVERDGRRG